ncbi:MAG: glutamine amidotransferase [Pseudohongiellaceae bacterium]
MKNKILIIKTGTTISSLLDEQEDFEDWFIRGSGLPPSRFICCAVDEGDALPAIAQVGAAIVTGSPAYVTDLAPWNYTAADYLRALHSQSKPILGVCYGHQLLAWAFGGEVDFHPGGREMGTVAITLTEAAEDDQLFASMPSQFQAQASHLQTVTKLPPDAVLLAKNDFEPHHGFRLGTTTWGVQYHPEFSAHVMRSYVRERKSDIAAEGLDVQDLLMEVEDTAVAAAMLQRFSELVDAQK